MAVPTVSGDSRAAKGIAAILLRFYPLSDVRRPSW
jgi:hypothetical protein